VKPPPKALGYFNDVMPPSLSSNHVYPPHQEAIAMAKKKAAKTAKAVGDATKNDPNQPPLPGMEEERIAPIERAMKKILDKRKEAKDAKEEADAELAKLPGLLKKHERQNYKCLGRVVVIEPGADIVKIKKVKDK
jgi:hypothetical protein